MWPTIIAIIIVVVLAGIFIVLTLLNRKIDEPEGCEQIRSEVCNTCNIAEKCKIKK